MPARRYFDFDLALVKAGKRTFRAHVIDSPAGTAQCDFQLPFSPAELDVFVLRVGRTRRGVRRIESPEMEAAKQFGGQLFQAVFSGDVQACLRSSLDQATAKDAGLRIRLRLVDAPELLNLPWEYLYVPSANRFLALSVSTPVVRYLELPERIKPAATSLPLRILVMISAPSDYAPLDVEHEWHNLQEALGPLVKRGAVQLERLPQATLRLMQSRLRQIDYHIFHFIGHGSFDQRSQDGLLLLEDDQGRGRPISGQVLGALLHDEKRLRLVVLNACEGARTGLADPFAGVAQSLVQQGLPAVIAMQFEVTDQAAITFSRDFYAAVSDGLPVDAALTEARKGIYASGNDVEWGTPVLFLRVADGEVFSISQPAAAEPASPAAAQPEQALSESQAGFKVDKLYYDALSAYLIEDYARAVELFGQVNALRPNFLDAPQKLAEARRRVELPGLRQQAEKAMQSGHWTAATNALEKIIALTPEDTTAARQLAQAQKQAQLASLYATARQFTEEKQWAAALRAWEQIDLLQTGYPDPENLRQAAHEGSAAEKKKQEAEAIYTAALDDLNKGDWAGGVLKLRRVRILAPGLPEAAALLERAEQRLAELARARQEEIKQKEEAVLEGRRQAAIQAELERRAAAERRRARLEADEKAQAAAAQSRSATPDLQGTPHAESAAERHARTIPAEERWAVRSGEAFEAYPKRTIEPAPFSQQLRTMNWAALARRWAPPLLAAGLAWELGRSYLLPRWLMPLSTPAFQFDMNGLWAGLLSGAGLAAAFAWVAFLQGRGLTALRAGLLILAWGASWFLGTDFIRLIFRYNPVESYPWIAWIYLGFFAFLPGTASALLLIPESRFQSEGSGPTARRILLVGFGWAVFLAVGSYFLVSSFIQGTDGRYMLWVGNPLSGAFSGVAGLLWTYWLLLRETPPPGR